MFGAEGGAAREEDTGVFEERWPGVVPVLEAGDEKWYAVSSLLRGLRGNLGVDMARLTRVIYCRGRETEMEGDRQGPS